MNWLNRAKAVVEQANTKTARAEAEAGTPKPVKTAAQIKKEKYRKARDKAAKEFIQRNK